MICPGYACPNQYLGFVNGQYWYYCLCCQPSGGNMQLYFTTRQTTIAACNGTSTCVYTGDTYRLRLSYPTQKGPTVDLPCADPGTLPTAADVILGMSAPVSPKLDFDEVGENVTKSEGRNVSYTDTLGNSYTVRVFELTLHIDKKPQLHVGFETTGSGSETFAFKSGTGHFHLITPKDKPEQCYNIFTVGRGAG
jgi:hypothetical protein